MYQYGCNILGVPFYLARYNAAACVYVWVYEYGCTIVLLHGCMYGYMDYGYGCTILLEVQAQLDIMR